MPLTQDLWGINYNNSIANHRNGAVCQRKAFIKTIAIVHKRQNLSAHELDYKNTEQIKRVIEILADQPPTYGITTGESFDLGRICIVMRCNLIIISISFVMFAFGDKLWS